MFTNQRILVTGGTGSWGHELISQLLPLNPKQVIVYSRSEATQVAMDREFEDPRLTFRVGTSATRKLLRRPARMSITSFILRR